MENFKIINAYMHALTEKINMSLIFQPMYVWWTIMIKIMEFCRGNKEGVWFQ